MSELSLIARIQALLGEASGRVLVGSGDDAAVVRAGGVLVSSIDTVTDGVHFELATHSPADVGHKALATALSDLAAMGAEPGEAYVALSLPPRFGEEQALELAESMRRMPVTIAGGDVSAGPVLSVTVTVNGWAESEERLAYRSGARPGDLVGVTGELGGSGAGLLLLRGLDVQLDPALRDALVERHLRPVPLLSVGRALVAAGVAAMIDVSDGVATDAGHIATSSEVAVEIELDRLPLAPGVAEVATAAGRDPAELAATAGDDYELLFTAPPERREAIERAAGVTWLGAVRPGAGLELLGRERRPVALRGYEHT